MSRSGRTSFTSFCIASTKSLQPRQASHISLPPHQTFFSPQQTSQTHHGPSPRSHLHLPWTSNLLCPSTRALSPISHRIWLAAPLCDEFHAGRPVIPAAAPYRLCHIRSSERFPLRLQGSGTSDRALTPPSVLTGQLARVADSNTGAPASCEVDVVLLPICCCGEERQLSVGPVTSAGSF
jgi:hypothetical protein